ncbi:MAG: radical SAM protein [Armatimonadota bacterium]
MYDIPALIADPALLGELFACTRQGKQVGRIRDAKIKITPRCNLRCVFCPLWKSERAGELTTDELKRTLDELAALDCRKVHLSGGEPTLRADLPAIIAHAVQLGMKTTLTSNGTLITEEMAEALLAAGLHGLAISLDGACPETHDAIRGVKGTFKRTVRGLRALRRTKKRLKAKTKVRLNTVLTRQTYHEYPELLALAGELGVNDVIPLPVDEGGKSKNRLLPPQLAEFNETITPAAAEIRAQYGFSTAPHVLYPFGRQRQDLRQSAGVEYARGYFHAHLCYAPWLTTLIGWTGDVWPCCMTRGKIPPLGNVREASFRDIFLGEAYESLRRQIITERLPLCHRCDNYLAECRQLEAALKGSS